MISRPAGDKSSRNRLQLLTPALSQEQRSESVARVGELTASGIVRTLRQDAVAGVPGAIASVPDGMASAVLVGVNPVYGLNASMAGPVGGGLAVSTRLMVVTTTTAAALAAGSALGSFSGADRPEALFVLSALAGLMMIAAGVLRSGRFTRFVSRYRC
jgi:sulfate permease, SulP family